MTSDPLSAEAKALNKVAARYQRAEMRYRNVVDVLNAALLNLGGLVGPAGAEVLPVPYP
jgi:hypothetical protein